MGRLGAEPRDDAIDAAQEIMYDAWEADDRTRRVALANKALKVSPLCADAYVLLALETAGNPDDAIALYRQGVEAGEKALGKAVFHQNVGDFWGLLETRPYMRARHGLALSLWDKGLRDEATTHYDDMLRLNPNDNQGIRYLLVDCLLTLGRDEEVARLLERYKDDGAAAWSWSRALFAFRRGGDGPESRSALALAIGDNKHVPAYLLGRRKMLRSLPDAMSWGGKDEAIAYVHGAFEAWAFAPGALSWLEAALAAASRSAKDPSMSNNNPVSETDVDPVRVDDAVLALLRLGLHDNRRVWKTFDWEVMNRLHVRGFISNPVGKAKSVELTEAGAARSEQLLHDLFGQR
jgi:tetratricopeptide (TPR) repeat protein